MADQFSKMYDVEVVGGDQKKRLAEMLRANALNTPQGQMVSGWYVPPSWSQNLAHLAQTATGVFGGIAADEEEKKAIQEDYKRFTAGQQAAALRKAGQPQGEPSVAAMEPAYPSSPAAGQMQDGEFRAMKTGGVQGMPNYNVAPQPVQQQPQIDINDPSQYKSPYFQKMLMQRNMQQALAVPEYSQTPQYDQSGRAFVLDKQGNMKYLGSDQTPIRKTVDYNDLVILGQDGKPMINPLALGAKQMVAKAGASNQTVINAGPKELNTQIGKGIGENIIATRGAAQKAFANNTQIDTLQQAVPNAIVGSGAEARIDLARLGDTLGVGGKTNQERLKNTSVLLQGFAQNELNAAEAMKGQGQITEGERAIIRRMAAGDINMTAGELQTGLGTLKKINGFKIAQHEQNLVTVKNDPNMREMYPYLAQPLTGFPTEVPQQPGAQQPAAAPRGGARFRGYVGQPR